MCCSDKCSNDFYDNSLIINSILSLVFSFIVLVSVNWDYGGKTGLVCFLILLIFSIINIIFASLIKLWRTKNKLTDSKKNASARFSYTSVTLCIISFIVVIIGENTTASNIYDINHPCQNNAINYSSNNNSIDCSKQSSTYNINIIKNSVSILIYMMSTFIEISCFYGIIIWCGEGRRISYGDEPEIIGNGLSPSYGINPGVIVSPFRDVYGAQYDCYGRQIIDGQQIEARVVNIQNCSPIFNNQGSNIYAENNIQINRNNISNMNNNPIKKIEYEDQNNPNSKRALNPGQFLDEFNSRSKTEFSKKSKHVIDQILDDEISSKEQNQ